MSLAAALWASSAGAAVITDAQLAAVPPDSGLAQFNVVGAPGLVLEITELAAATMTGSELFGYTGLWLGSGGEGSRYQIDISTPVQRLELSFVGLTNLGEDEVEWLSGLATDRATVIALSSPDNSATWDGSTLLPLAEDGRGSLRLVAATSQGFSRFSFVHNQGVPLQGWVITQIELDALPVPEPSPLVMWAAGGLALWQLARRRSA